MGDLNGLIKALREEIAISGDQGATVDEVLKGVETFYQRKAKLRNEDEAGLPLQNIDRAFKERVWTWLCKDRFVRIGEDNEGNALTLNEIEARNLQEPTLRLFTTEQQIWIALTGHEKDGRKIPPKSFELLEIIAAHRGQGITQPELVRIAGQDKRSVPLRTQKLADAGHIKKIPVLANHSNTSLLIHTRFIDDFAIPETGQQIAAPINSESAPDRLFLGHNRFVRAEKQIRDAIDVLEKNNGLLMWSDLKKKINVSDPSISKVLAEGIRKLEELGVTVRVRASASLEQFNVNKTLHRCIQLKRSPTEHDWRMLFEWTKQEQSRRAGTLPPIQEFQEEGESQPVEQDNIDIVNHALERFPVGEKHPQDLHIPTWSPDRLLTHTIRSALLSVGTTGLATKDLKRIVTGPFYMRPIDRVLDRCVWKWQKSQPLHLRHLAIVRDSAQLGKTSFYVHFVHDAFGIKVENQETIWEAVQSYPETNESVAYDQYGFATVPPSAFVGQRRDMTLKKALEFAGSNREILKFEQTSSSARPKVIKTGLDQVKYASRKSRARLSEDTQHLTDVAPVVIGRPRKYPTANTTLDFSNMTPEEIKKIVTSQQRAQEYLRKKARKQVKERVALGIPETEAEETVLAELDLTAEAYAGNTIQIPSLTSPAKASRPNKRKRRSAKTQYMPSIVAHTTPLYQSVRPVEPPRKKQKQIQQPKSAVPAYLPSVLAHTQLLHENLRTPTAARKKGTKQKKGTLNEGIHTTETSSPDGIPAETPSEANDMTLESSINDDRGREDIPTVLRALKSSTPTPSLKRKASFTEAATSLPTAKKQLTTGGEAVEPSQEEKAAGETNTPTVNDKEVMATTELDQSEITPVETNHEASSAVVPDVDIPTRHTKKVQASRMAPFGGTIATMRKLIILGIIRNCGGAFPGDGELAYPFLTAYVKKFPEAKPDNKTIKLAKTTLIGEGKLKQIFFTCKSPSGLIQSKSIIALPEVSDADQRIKDLQRSMAKCHPHPYFPPGTNIRPDLIPKAASYNATGLKIARHETYANDLPIISDLVVPHYPWKSHDRSTQKASVAADERSNPDDAQSEQPVSPQSKKRKRKSKVQQEGQMTIEENTIDKNANDEMTVNEAQTPIVKPKSRGKKPGTNDSNDQALGQTAIEEIVDGGLVAGMEEQRAAKPKQKRKVGKKTAIEPDQAKLKHSAVATERTLDSLMDTQQPFSEEPTSKRRGRTLPGLKSINVEQTAADQPEVEQTSLTHPSQERADVAKLAERPPPEKRRKSKAVLTAEAKEVEVQVSVEQVKSKTRGKAKGNAGRRDTNMVITDLPEPVNPALPQDEISLNSQPAPAVLPGQPEQNVNSSRFEQLGPSSPQTAIVSSIVDDAHLPELLISEKFRAEDQSKQNKRPRSKPGSMPPSFQQTPRPEMQELAPSSAFIATPSLPSGQDGTPWEWFSSMTDNVIQWEKSKPEGFSEASRSIFVHYPFPKGHHDSVPVEINPVGRKVVEKSNPKPQEKKRKRTAAPQEIDLPQDPTQKKKQKQGVSQKPQTVESRSKKTKHPMPKLSALELLAQKGETTPGVRYSKGKDSQLRQVESRRSRYQFNPADDRKLLIACIFGHIALGGVREENHWAIVSRMLDQKYDKELCRRRWSSVKTRYRGDVEVIAAELRSALLDSYERGDAPTLDFANFWENDWTGILAWAVDKIESPEAEDIELPTTREAFEAMFLTQNFAEHDGPDFLESKRVASVPSRQAVLNSGARVLQDIPEKDISDLHVAKTHVRANILTPEDSYKPQEAKAKLAQFPGSIIEEAVNELMTDRIVAQANKGRALPQRSYDLSTFFLRAMQWKLSVSHFKYAAAFKEILDSRFKDDAQIEYKPAFGNGDMIALLNLLADDMIRIKGKNIPSKKFGLTKDGYKTRTMDKKVFNFDVFAEPTKTYSYGHPSRPLPQPPRSNNSPAEQDTRIPLWIDLNGDLLPIMWDLALAVVGTILVVHTTADAKNIAERTQPCLAEFEVQLIMEWLVDANVAEWKDGTHDVLNLKTFWWSVITTPIAKGGGSNEEAVMIAGIPLA